MAAELSRPKLLFRIVDCFNPALQAQFAQEYRDCRQWTFEVVLEFINRQISNSGKVILMTFQPSLTKMKPARLIESRT